MFRAPLLMARISFAVCLAAACGSAIAADERPLLPWDVLAPAADRHFQSLGIGPQDICTQGDVEKLLERIDAAGWGTPYREQLLTPLLPADHFLVTFSRSEDGRRFLGEASKYPMLYDRLDRISEADGGKRTLTDVARLPNGARYARTKPGGFVPDLVDLLPKKDGFRAQVPDYGKPTGRVYTRDDVMKLWQGLHK